MTRAKCDNVMYSLLPYFLLFLLMGGGSPAHAAQIFTAKSSLIHAMLDNTVWPNEDQMSHFTVGLYGRQRELLRALEKEFKNQKIRGKPVKVRYIVNLDDARPLQLFVIPSEANRHLEKISEALERSRTLIVTEGSSDKQNIMINFTLKSRSLSFEVNSSNIVYAGMKVSKELLLFGGTELDVARIYKKTEAKLAKFVDISRRQRLELEAQELTLKTQQENLDAQKQHLESQSQKMKKQSDMIEARETELKAVETSLKKTRNSLQDSEVRLDNNLAVLAAKDRILKDKEASLARYAKDIDENMSKLERLQTQIDSKENRIAEQKAALVEERSTIRYQRFILAAGATIMFVILSLIILVVRSYRSKQRLYFNLEQKTGELESANQQLVEMTEAKSLFLSTMSHEIRTPMNGVLGMVELLKDTSTTEQQDVYLETINNSGGVLLGVINDILDYSKIEAGKLSIEDVEFDLEQLIYDCTSIFSLQSKADLVFSANISPGVPVQLKGDPIRIRQILLNLLSNAFKFTADGHIRLEVEEITDSSDQKHLRITVKDTGTGMSAEQCDKIFQAFTQADSSTTRCFGGTGLGLAISQRLALLMGGSIELESELNAGSTFTLNLPKNAVDSKPVQQDIKLLDCLVLIASEDEQLEDIAAHVKSWGMNVHRVNTLDEVRASMADKKPDVLLLGESFYDKLGLDLAKELSDSKDTLTIFLLSGAVKPINVARHNDRSVPLSLNLPLSPSKLRQIVEDHLDGIANQPEEAVLNKETDYKQFSDAKVLVAEDNLVNQMVIKGLLGRQGITPAIAKNGREAVNQYLSSCSDSSSFAPFDIILMDCEMPELDGLEATREIRELEAMQGREHIPIVALTAHVMEDQRRLHLSSGMDDHLAKPLKPKDLETILNRYC